MLKILNLLFLFQIYAQLPRLQESLVMLVDDFVDFEITFIGFGSKNWDTNMCNTNKHDYQLYTGTD